MQYALKDRICRAFRREYRFWIHPYIECEKEFYLKGSTEVSPNVHIITAEYVTSSEHFTFTFAFNLDNRYLSSKELNSLKKFYEHDWAIDILEITDRNGTTAVF